MINICYAETHFTTSLNIDAPRVTFDLAFCVFTFDLGCYSIFRKLTLV